MFTALHPRHLGSDVTVVLEEVEVAPVAHLVVVDRTLLLAFWAGKFSTPFRADFQLQLMGGFIGIQVLIKQRPWGFQAQSQHEDIVLTHYCSPC